MNSELEALIRAYDAVLEASQAEAKHFQAIYASRLEDALERHPKLSRASLSAAVIQRHAAWRRAQKKPPTLPPQA